MKKNEIIFFVGIFIICLINIANSSKIIDLPEIVQNTMLLLAYITFIIQILINEKDIKKLVIYSIMILFGIILYITTKQTIILTLILVLLSSRKIETKKIVKYLFFINIAILLVHILLYACNIIFEFKDIEYVYRGKNRIRHSFFFNHPNPFSGYVFWIVAMYVYLKEKKLKWLDYLIILAISVLIYIFPNSKTTSICLILLIIVDILFNKIDINKKTFSIIIKNIFIIIALFLAIAMLTYPISNTTKIIDKTLNSRVKLASAANKYFGISLLGQELPFNQRIDYMKDYRLTGLTMDSTYYLLLCSFGIIPFMLYLFFTRSTMSLLYKENRKKDIMLFFILAIFSMMESWCLNPILAFPLLFMNKFEIKKGD